jgi:hypothetical protein
MTTTGTTTTYDVYRWNGELAYHIFPTSDEMPTAALCGTAFPDTDAAREFWGLWRRQSGSLEDMRAWIIATPLLSGHICAGCQNA